MHIPSGKASRKKPVSINLVPFIDSLLVLIFFLLTVADFLNLFEIQSPVPIVSNEPPPKEQKEPLALTLQIEDGQMVLFKGVPQHEVKRFPNLPNKDYDLLGLHDALIGIKKENASENSIIFNPVDTLEYEKIVKIMDSARLLRKTDEAIYSKNAQGIDAPVTMLFPNIVFGNTL